MPLRKEADLVLMTNGYSVRGKMCLKVKMLVNLGSEDVTRKLRSLEIRSERKLGNY